RHERAQGVPPRQRPEPRLAQLAPHGRHRQHPSAHRAAAEEAEVRALSAQEADLDLLGRAARIGVVLTRYGLGERAAADVPLGERARSLRAPLEELGPTFAKLGQILSPRPDLLPPEFIAELSTLQDRVPPMTEEEVVSVMEEALGVPWEDVFEHIDS